MHRRTASFFLLVGTFFLPREPRFAVDVVVPIQDGEHNSPLAAYYDRIAAFLEKYLS
jgi:hypothetical protein